MRDYSSKAAIIAAMRRFLIFLALLLLACRAFTPFGVIESPPSVVTLPVETAEDRIPLVPSTPLPDEIATLPPAPTPSPESPSDLYLQQEITYTVLFHPDGGLYVGDLVSLEVIAPPGLNMEGRSVEVQVDPPQGEKFAPVKFSGYGIANRQQATFTWAWDTQGLPPGEHTLSFAILPDGPAWTETVLLQPQSALPPPEPQAQWASAKSECCILYYITGTAAERDLPALIDESDRQANRAAAHFGISFNEPITITLIPRLLGHGGFASNEISVSYLDRNYAGSQFSQVLYHEMVHILDGRLGGELRPTLLVEGLAVYLTGGHYKPEPLLSRAAALLKLQATSLGQDAQWYFPLASLADNFYPSQHEIGYLQAGALVEYMVDTWGWEAFSAFYRDIHPDPSESQARAIDQALQKHFNLSLEALEKAYLDYLLKQEVTPDLMDDVRLTVAFYDTVRRYQQLLDPSAYFQTAWLLDNSQMRQRGIVADYLRRPSAPINVALETLLVAAGNHLRLGRYSEAEKILIAVGNELDEIEALSAVRRGEVMDRSRRCGISDQREGCSRGLLLGSRVDR